VKAFFDAALVRKIVQRVMQIDQREIVTRGGVADDGI